MLFFLGLDFVKDAVYPTPCSPRTFAVLLFLDVFVSFFFLLGNSLIFIYVCVSAYFPRFSGVGEKNP